QLGAQSVALAGGVGGADEQPVAALWRHVAEQAGAAADRGDEQVHAAVTVEVRVSQAAADVRSRAQRRLTRRAVAEPAPACVGEALVPLQVAVPVRVARQALRDGRVPGDPAVDEGDVWTSVVAEIREADAEAGAAPARRGQAGGAAAVAEQAARA